MGIQGLFPLTHWHSCALNGCLGGVPTHSLVFTCTHKHSEGVQYSIRGVQPVQILKGPIDMFSNMGSTLRPYKFALNFHWMPFLQLCQTKRLDVRLEYMIGRWSWCLPMRLATKNKKVVQKFRNLDRSQVLFNYCLLYTSDAADD